MFLWRPYFLQCVKYKQDNFFKLCFCDSQVWDVISNEEAVQIVSSSPRRNKSAKMLVKCAARAWKRKKRGIAMDDISVICLFFKENQSVDSLSKVAREANVVAAVDGKLAQ